MYGKIIIAIALVGAMSTSAFAEWVVVQAGGQCMLLEESAVKGEVRIAGPFATEEEAEKAKGEHPKCAVEKN